MRACVEGIDERLNGLVSTRLGDGQLASHSACQRVVGAMLAGAGEQPPEAVPPACSCYALHTALLDWQASLLDRLAVDRPLRFPDLDRDSDRGILHRVLRHRHQTGG